MEETTFYNRGNVTVTQSRLIVDDKTYAMRNISSVQIGVIKADKNFAYGLLIIGICLIAFTDEYKVWGIVGALIGVAIIYLLKDRYSVRINTNSGETDGVIANDKDLIQEIVAAVNDAIIHRG